MTLIIWYLAGPMSHIKSFNFPAFEAAAAKLRDMGYLIVSPAELDNPADYAAAMASPDGKPTDANGTWGDYLARDVKIVADEVSGIIFLPGWEKSRGARLEAYTGILCGHQFAFYDNGDVTPLTTEWVRARL